MTLALILGIFLIVAIALAALKLKGSSPRRPPSADEVAPGPRRKDR